MKHGVGGLVRVGRVIAALALAAAAMSACGGSSKAKDAADDKPQDQEVGAEATTTTAKPAPKATKKDAPTVPADDVTTTTTTSVKAAQTKGDPNAPRLSVPDTMPNDGKKLELRAEMAKACVRPGTAQTITIHAKPGSGVGYNTYYADGKHGLSEGYYGGNYGGYTDENGTWSDTWVLAPNAAPGKADVAVLGAWGSDERGETRASFVVADATGLCG